MSFKDCFYFLSSVCHFAKQSETVWAVLMEGLMRTYFAFGPAVLRVFYHSSGGHYVWRKKKTFVHVLVGS